jgi:hypothetical protein
MARARDEGGIMRGDITLAGFLLTAEEWQSFDSTARAQLVTVAARREEAAVVEPLAGVSSEPTDNESAGA